MIAIYKGEIDSRAPWPFVKQTASSYVDKGQ